VGQGELLHHSAHSSGSYSPEQVAKETLYWHRPFTTVRTGSFQTGDITYFPEGGLNASYNCVDRWAFKHPDKVRPHRT
jgi:acetyl-CoA synthetase